MHRSVINPIIAKVVLRAGSFGGCAHNVVPLTRGFYFPENSDAVPESELSRIESLSHNLNGNKYEKVQHEDHWDFMVSFVCPVYMNQSDV